MTTKPSETTREHLLHIVVLETSLLIPYFPKKVEKTWLKRKKAPISEAFTVIL